MILKTLRGPKQELHREALGRGGTVEIYRDQVKRLSSMDTRLTPDSQLLGESLIGPVRVNVHLGSVS